ncbi:MAG: DegT/DnrJ/EryC1/StrS family aminotransferase [Ramlibacter sp.]|nr:DegT/DnrJ/EryC1/StrS family aminotransferase [Ramlibacter sp.]
MIEYENLKATNQGLSGELFAAVKRVIDSGWYVLGEEVRAFEQEFAHSLQSAHCVGVANGLDALTLSFKALELAPNSEVLVASNTYIATILAIVHAGLTPVLVEPDLATYNMDPRQLLPALTRHTAAICVTHLYGKPCRMDLICAFATEHGLHVVEDCAQSHGARLKDKATGTFGISGCFSFYPTKNLGALGDAGAIVTNDESFADRLRHWRNYGSKVKYVNTYAGYNSRLDEMQAAILRVKLAHLDAITTHKRRLAAMYFNLLPRELVLPACRDDEVDVFHIFAVRHARRDALRGWLLDQGIKTEVHYPIPPHRQEAMKGVLSGDYPIAEQIHSSILSLPISFATSEQDVQSVCETIPHFPGLRD